MKKYSIGSIDLNDIEIDKENQNEITAVLNSPSYEIEIIRLCGEEDEAELRQVFEHFRKLSLQMREEDDLEEFKSKELGGVD